MKEQVVLTSVAVLYRKKGEDTEWFLVKEDKDSDWNLARTVVRHGESSVRASIRLMGEDAGMRVKILEEVGRHGGAAKVNGKVVTQRIIYYLMFHKGGDQILGFVETGWFDYTTALRKLTSKRDKEMFKDARILLSEIRAKNKAKKLALAK